MRRGAVVLSHQWKRSFIGGWCLPSPWIISSSATSPPPFLRRVAPRSANLCSAALLCAQRSASTSAGPAPTSTSPQPPPPPPVAEVPTVRILSTVTRHLWPKDNWRLRACVVASIVCMMAAKATRVAVPFWFRSVIDALAPGASVTAAVATVGPVTLSVFGLVVAYGITRLTTSFTDEAKAALFAPVGAHASTQVSRELFEKIHSLDLRFHLSRQTGVLAKDMDRGSRAFWSLAYALLFMVIPTGFEMGLVCLALNSQAGLHFVAAAVVAVVSYISWTYQVSNWRAKFRDRYNTADSKVGGMMVDTLLNYETVKYFGRESHEVQRMTDEVRIANRSLGRLDQTMAVLNFGQQAIFTLAATWCLYYSTGGVLAGTMTVGDLVLVDALLLQLYSPLSWLGMLYREVQTSTQNMQAMLRIKDQNAGVQDAPDAKEFEFRSGDITLRDVSFSYSVNELAPAAPSTSSPPSSSTEQPSHSLGSGERRVILKNVNLVIPGGSCVAFVGPSGCGKSTLFRLLFRFFDPDEGSVLIDGQDIRTVRLASLRRYIGVIPQDCVLFNQTVLENIRYGNLAASDEECIRAAKAANVHDCILRLSDQYDTVVGERGLRLSGGEKQRVAIARALLYDAPILLADEATSALDGKTELCVMQTLRDAKPARIGDAQDKDTSPRFTKRTILMIAHRLTSVRNADIIFVLDGRGGICECGTHDVLLSQQGAYYQMWQQQLHERKEQRSD